MIWPPVAKGVSTLLCPYTKRNRSTRWPFCSAFVVQMMSNSLNLLFYVRGPPIKSLLRRFQFPIESLMLPASAAVVAKLT